MLATTLTWALPCLQGVTTKLLHRPNMGLCPSPRNANKIIMLAFLASRLTTFLFPLVTALPTGSWLHFQKFHAQDSQTKPSICVSDIINMCYYTVNLSSIWKAKKCFTRISLVLPITNYNLPFYLAFQTWLNNFTISFARVPLPSTSIGHNPP